MKEVHIFDPKKNTMIIAGTIATFSWEGKDYKAFMKKVDSRKHLLRKHGCYAIQESARPILIKEEVEKVLINETDTGILLMSDFPDAWSRVINLGHGNQMLATRSKMKPAHRL